MFVAEKKCYYFWWSPWPVSKQTDLKTNPLLYGEPVQIDEDRCNVVVFAPLSDETNNNILTHLKLGDELLGNAKH